MVPFGLLCSKPPAYPSDCSDTRLDLRGSSGTGSTPGSKASVSRPPVLPPHTSAASRVLVASSGLTAPRSPLCTGESLWAGSPREAHSSDLEGTGHQYPLHPGPRGQGLSHCLVSLPELVLGRAFLDVTTCTSSVCARPWVASGRLRGFEDFFLCLQNGDGISPRVPGAWLSEDPATVSPWVMVGKHSVAFAIFPIPVVQFGGTGYGHGLPGTSCHLQYQPRFRTQGLPPPPHLPPSVLPPVSMSVSTAAA